MEELIKQSIIKVLSLILLEDDTNSRINTLNSFLVSLEILKPQLSKELLDYVDRIKRLKERISTYISSGIQLLKDIQELFPEFYDELMKIPDLIIYNAISKVRVKRYASGKILVIIPLPDATPGNIYEFKFRDVSRVREAIESKKYNKLLIERYEVLEILKAYGLKEENLSEELANQLVIKFNKMLADYIISQYKKVLPFEDRNEELEFEKFKRFLTEWEHVFYWIEDRGEFFESAGIDPDFVVFVKDNYVYIPTKLINMFISTKRFSNIILKLTDYYAKVFKTSYMIFGKKHDIRYLVLPVSLLKTSLGITLEPKDPKEFIKEEEKERKDIEEEFEKLEQQKDDRHN